MKEARTRFYRIRPDSLIRCMDVRVISILPANTDGALGKRQGFVVAVAHGPGLVETSEILAEHRDAVAFLERLIAGEFTKELLT